MKIFEHMNVEAGEVCPVCKTKEDKPITLIGIVGTEEDGNIQAVQVHVDCIDLLYYPEHNLLAQKLGELYD